MKNAQRSLSATFRLDALHPIAIAAASALLMPALLPSAHAAETLPTVEVTAPQEALEGLGLNQPSTTGSRTGISRKNTPASVEQVDEQTLQQRGDYDVVSAVNRTVGLTSQGTGGNGGMAFTSRGFAGVGSVGIAEDGMRLGVASGTVTYPNDSWGYERIEVLRGPASIVYGTGTAGATINAVRKQPSRERFTEVLTGIGQNGTARLGLGTTGALGETASYRVDVYGHHSDGERAAGRAKGGKFMGTLRLEPSSDLRFELLADISDQKPSRYWGTPTVNGHIEPSLRGENYNTHESVMHYEDQRLRARAHWKANEWLSLNNELYHFKANRHWNNFENYNFNPASGTVTRSGYEVLHDLEQTGNRLEAAIKTGAHALVAGWEVSQADFAPSGGSSCVTQEVAAHAPSHHQAPCDSVVAVRWDSDTVQHALYLEDAWQINDKWMLLAGLRRDWNDFERNEYAGGTPFAKKLHGTAWRLGVTHHLNASTNLYAQFSQGHDPVTNVLSINLANRDFKLTTARQVEVGIKQQLGQGLGEWTLAAYRIEKDDIITRDPLDNTISVQGGSQHAKGLELSAVITPAKAWRLEGNYALSSARFDELMEAGGADRSGNRPANVPLHVANLWGHYRIGNWQASLGGRYVGKRHGDNANTITLPSYTVVDAALSWQYNRNTTLRLLGRNLGDKVYATAAYNSGRQFILGAKRQFEFVAEFKF